MTDTSTFLLELMAGISVIFAVFYLILRSVKAKAERENPFSGAELGTKGVTVRYDGKETMMWLHFYTDGLIFEKETGKRMYVPEKNIVSVTSFQAEPKFGYKLVFDPKPTVRDSFDIISAEDIMQDFTKTVRAEKLS